MIIDCDACAVRNLECGDCVVTVLLGAPPASGAVTPDRPGVELDGREQAAIAVLASSGLVPPLRLVTRGGDEVEDATGTDSLGLPLDGDGTGDMPARRRAAG